MLGRELDDLRWVYLHRVAELDALKRGIPVEILGVIDAFHVLSSRLHVMTKLEMAAEYAWGLGKVLKNLAGVG